MKYRGIIFDLDGTLVDTLDDLTNSMNVALAQLKRPLRTRDECRQMIGHGCANMLNGHWARDFEHLTDDLMTRMVVHYADHCLLKTAPYPGMKETVTVLLDQGVRLAVLTNKNQAPAEVMTRHYFGDSAFNPIVGAADGRKPKPDPQTALEILKQWDMAADEVLFVGDSEPDMQTSRNAGLRAVGCEWGFRSREVLIAAGADVLIQTPGQIMELVTVL